ncbi:hypothetical protein JG688_00002856 [Phytophthora aleatoria]|uniref:Uncharacterized protein n=1 Tax=Phytophthora aleatoria TaxID=2496075 RepID=A0A8J5MHN4_9STRA|nr:hypothetical protein JG688_00002856 [Phytophthora aleatoria]
MESFTFLSNYAVKFHVQILSVQTPQTRHLLSKDDSVGKTNTNQEGTDPRDPRHIYANPFCPSTY